MTDEYYYDLAEFGPSEVARLTGVTPDVQRDWRRRGVIVMEVEGRARFFLDQVCQIMLMKAVSDLGVQFADARTGAVFSSVILQLMAIEQPDALDFDPALSDAQRKRASASTAEGSYRFLVIAPSDLTPDLVERLTGKSPGSHLREMWPLWPVGDWDGVERAAEVLQSLGACGFGVIDIKAMAVKLAKSAERPLAIARPGASASPNRTILAALGGLGQ